jgi:signal transduction histidine kinase/CheY-like chemotaxis protein/HAMP domain-containing protein
MGKSLKGKIIIPAIIVLTSLVLILTAFSSVRFSNFTNRLFNERLGSTANILKRYLEISGRESRAAAVSMAKDTEIINAVKNHDAAELTRLITPLLELYNVNICTVADETGIVLLRTHDPGHAGDSVLKQQNIKDALDGKVSTYCEEGTAVLISVRTGSPVYDVDGTLIGVISAGVRLDTVEAVDSLKERYDYEFSVFYGDIRVATTITMEGKRITGTQLEPAVAKILRETESEYFGNTDIMGEKYSIYFLPLINSQGEMFAILSTAKSNTDLIAERTGLLISDILIGVLGLFCALVILLIIITKITNPVKRLADLVLNVTNGNIDAAMDITHVTKDEIGALMIDVYSLIGIIKAMLNDLSRLTYEMNTYSDITAQADTSAYSGAYKEIIDGINALVNTVAMMKKVMTVMDNLDSMILVVDFDYNLVYINRSLAHTFAVDINCYKGNKCYAALRGLDHPCSFCLLPTLMAAKESFPSQAYNFLYDDVCDMWVGGQAAIIRWVDGTMVYFQSLNDETEKKRDQLALKEAVQSAEMASVAKSAFLANMSHELRTPLNVVVGLADLQLEEGELPQDIRETLNKISNAGSTLLSIVNDILDISKIESGNFVLVPIEYHVASLLNDTASLVTSRIGEKPVAFRLNVRDDIPSKLYGDDLRVKQILNNLLSNALKYTHKGSVELNVHCERTDHDVWMEITVTDTGIGIRPKDIKKLFANYSQVDTKANRKSEGTGLGLAISKKLVESMDGEISVKSVYGRGSTFHVKIRQGFVTDVPIGPEVAENLRKSRYSENKRHFARTLVRADLSYANVLVVDDLQANLDLAAGLMRKYNMGVDCVSSGQAAVERIRLGQPVYSAIFMDHMMPEMDGIEAAETIRALGSGYAQTIPIIALTANAVVGTKELFFEHGFQAFVSKPIDIMQLDSVIQQWVRDKSQEKAPAERPETLGSPAQASFLTKEYPVIVIPGIDTEKGLSICDGDLKIYLSTLRSYVADTSALLEKIRDVTAQSLPSYTISVHGIKGSSATIGAEAVRAAAAELEMLGKKGDLGGILALNGAFLQEGEYLVAALREWLEQQAAKTAKPRLSEPNQALLAKLRQSCEQYDFESADKIMNELESASYEKNGELVKWLREKIDIFDFEEIVIRLAE